MTHLVKVKKPKVEVKKPKADTERRRESMS